MLRRPFVSLTILVLSASPLLAGLLVGSPRPFPTVFEPALTEGPVTLTANDGLFLATYFNTFPPNREAVRLDTDGDPLDIPPRSIRAYPREPVSGAVPAGSGWLIASSLTGMETTRITIERVAPDGEAAITGEFTVPLMLRQFRLTGADGSYALLAQVQGSETSAVVTFDSAIRASAPLILDGVTIAIEAGGGRFAALQRDRVVILTSEPSVVTTIPLPPLLDPRTIIPLGSSFVVVGVRGDAIELLEIREGALVPFSSIAAQGAGSVAADSSRNEVLVLWTAGSRLIGARATAAGLTEGPVDLGAHGYSLYVEGDDGGWLTVGWKGPSPGIAATRRIDRTTPLSNLVDDVDPVKWIAYYESALGIATSGDTALALWRRGCPSLDDLFGCDRIVAKLFDTRGEPIGAEIAVPPLLSAQSAAVAGRESGFLLYGRGVEGLVAYEWTAGAGLDPTPIVIAPWPFYNAVIGCAGEVCLAAWRVHYSSQQGPAVRVARIVGRTVLDPGGIAISHEDGYGRIGLASDGSRFLLAFTHGVPGGAIGRAALIDPSGALDYRSFGVTAVTGPTTYDVWALWSGSVFEMVQSAGSSGAVAGHMYRVARIRTDGSVVEGDESAWQGWPLEIEGAPQDAFRTCGSSYFASSRGFVFSESAIYEIAQRSARPVASVPLALEDVACFAGGGCLAIGEGPAIVPMSCERERVVAR